MLTFASFPAIDPMLSKSHFNSRNFLCFFFFFNNALDPIFSLFFESEGQADANVRHRSFGHRSGPRVDPPFLYVVGRLFIYIPDISGERKRKRERKSGRRAVLGSFIAAELLNHVRPI